MRKSRFWDEQVVAILREADREPIAGYERDHPGDMIHIDIKKLGRFDRVGHRITGNRQLGEANDFALAEEVTLKGGHERRPDLVVYLNGFAVAVVELKRSSVEIGDGIRQLISNQDEIFNAPFFATGQLLLAGSDAQGLRYGTMGTPETLYVEWRDEDATPGDLAAGALLDRPVGQMLRKDRLLDLIRNFSIFDAGIKKVPRQHQFVGVKLAQGRLGKREGGVIWHTQGSGKSILMVLLAKWILEREPDARVLVVTDRDELDKQIEGVMRNADVISADAPSPIRCRTDMRHDRSRSQGCASLPQSVHVASMSHGLAAACCNPL